jgi:hypothetical protein
VENDNVVHKPKSTQNCSAIFLRHQWTASSLYCTNRYIAVYSNNKPVTARSRALEQIYMTGMKQVKTTVGKN